MKLFSAVALAAMLACPALALSADSADVDTLIRELRSVNPNRRAKAADALADLGPQAAPAVRSLMGALTDPSRKVQIGALIALERIGPEARAAVPELVQLLKGKDLELYPGAVAALSAIGHDADEAVPELVALLQGDDEELATSAGLALVRILPSESDDLRQVIPILVKSLKSDDPVVRSDAVAGLGSAGRLALPALIRLVRGQAGDSRSAWQAAAALQAMGPLAEPAVTVLTDALESDDEQVVIRAAGALGAIGAAAKPAVDELQKQLSGPNAAIRTHVASALGDLGPVAEDAVGDLATALQDPDEGVRREAAEALGKIGPAAKDAIPALVTALNDDAGTVTVHAAWALSRIGPDAVPALVTALKEEKKLRHLIVAILGDIGEAAKPAVATLAEYLADPQLDPELGREIMLTLARVGPGAKAAVGPMLKILGDPENPLRAGAAYALAKLGAKEARPLLVQALASDDDPEMQVVAPIALVLLSPDRDALINLALPRLVELLGDESNHVRHEALEALASIGPRAAAAVPQLVAGLADPDPGLRAAYLSTLGEIGPDAADALPVIMKALADPDLSVRCSASYAIGKIGAQAQEAIPLLEKNVKARDAVLQMASAWALVHVNPRLRGLADLCLGPLTHALKHSDPAARSHAAEALGMMGTAAVPALTALEGLLQDPDEIVRQSAAAAIKRIAR
jgi:HEAT repeat protein